MSSYEFFNDVDIKGNVLYNAVAHQAASNPAGKADGFWYYNTVTRRFMFQQDGVFSAFGMTNPMTTPGDIIIGGLGGVPIRLGVGSEGQILTAVNGVPAWEDPPEFPEPTPSVTPPLPPATTDGTPAFYIYAQGSLPLDPAYEGYWYPANAVTNEGHQVYLNMTTWARTEYSDYTVVSLHATHEDAIAGTNAVYVVGDDFGGPADYRYAWGWIFPAEDGWDQYQVNLRGVLTTPS